MKEYAPLLGFLAACATEPQLDPVKLEDSLKSGPVAAYTAANECAGPDILTDVFAQNIRCIDSSNPRERLEHGVKIVCPTEEGSVWTTEVLKVGSLPVETQRVVLGELEDEDGALLSSSMATEYGSLAAKYSFSPTGDTAEYKGWEEATGGVVATNWDNGSASLNNCKIGPQFSGLSDRLFQLAEREFTQ